MQSTAIIEVLSRALPVDAAAFEAVDARDGMPTIVVPLERVADVSLTLRDAPELRFVFLADIAAVDYHPREPRFELVYILASPGVGGYGDAPKRLRMKVRVASGAHVPSVASVWMSANWAEREVYDFFGVQFDGHPDLRRILMPEDWEGFPMRKDYPVQIKQPVKTYEPLQVSEEEFVANIEAVRRRARQGLD
jgi:NADH-quinone oxidoreductase subunit C